MTGRLSAFLLHGGLVVETELDPKVQPFLFDHRIDGTPVLPGVMGIEAFAEAAAALVPGFRVAAVEDVDFLAPFKFYRDEPRTVRVEAILRPAGDGVEAECRLVGRRTLPGQAEPQETVHFRARVRLERGDARLETVAAALENPGTPLVCGRHLLGLLPRPGLPGPRERLEERLRGRRPLRRPAPAESRPGRSCRRSSPRGSSSSPSRRRASSSSGREA